MNLSLLFDNNLLLKRLKINSKTLAIDFSGKELTYYIGVFQWLTKYKPKSESSAIEKIKGFSEAIFLLCKLQAWEKIQIILKESFPINSNISLPIYEYFLYNDLSKELLVILEEILSSLNNSKYDLTFAYFLKARAMLATSNQLEEAQLLLKELFDKSINGTEIHIESLAYLGMQQVNSGKYQIGIENLESALTKINRGKFEYNHKIQELKTDIMENLALYEMNASNFQEATKLYSDVIELREKLGLFHKIVGLLAHQGIISRKNGDYDNAKRLLEKAKNQAIKFGSESQVVWISHHLAYVFLNQGKPELSKKLSDFAIKGYQKFENQWGVSDCYEQLGLIYLALKQFPQAEEKFRLSLNIRDSIGNRHGKASSVLDLALVFWNQRNFPKSIFYLLKGFYLYFKLGILNRTRFRRMLKLAFVWTLGNKRWTM